MMFAILLLSAIVGALPTQPSVVPRDSYYGEDQPHGKSLGYIAIAAIIPVGIVVWLIAHCVRSNPTAVNVPEVKNWGAIERDDESRIREQVQIREEQERRISPGLRRVWFSRCLEYGHLQHWALGIDGVDGSEAKKYELGQVRAGPSPNESARLNPSGSGSREEYTFKIKPWNLDMQRREANVFNQLVPVTGNKSDNNPTPSNSPPSEFYVCLIGWTELSDDGLANKAQEIMEGFGTYNLIFNNCQSWAIQSATSIIAEDKRAADWEWFETNTKTPYQAMVKLQAPEAIVWMDERMVPEGAKFIKTHADGGSPLNAAVTGVTNISGLAHMISHLPI